MLNKDEYSWLIQHPLEPEFKKTNSCGPAGQAKDISSPNPILKLHEEAVIESEAGTAVV